jgi:hypothetical protein
MKTGDDVLLWVLVILVGSFAAEVLLMTAVGATAWASDRLPFSISSTVFLYSVFYPAMLIRSLWILSLPILAAGAGLIAVGIARPARGHLALVGAAVLAVAWVAPGLLAFADALLRPGVSL